MDEPRTYDAAIIGAGQAGVPLARSLARAGWRTALIERAHVGGSCINEGCTPSKTMVASARVAALARRGPDYGVLTGDVAVDLDKVQERVRAIVERWRDGSERGLVATENLDLLKAEARFTAPHQLQLRPADGDAFLVDAERIFVNVGCRPAVPEQPGLADVPFLTSTTILELDSIPEHLLVLGGGYVAVEFGQMFRRFGSRVTVIQRRHTLLSHEDTDMAEALGAILREDGVHLILNAQARSVRTAGDGHIELLVTTPEGETTVTGSHLLVATGRTPNTDRLDPQAAGLEIDEKGYLPVNDRLESRVPGVYVLGDVKGGPAFTHIAYDDFRVIRTNLLQGGDRTVAGRLVPYVVFSDPQLGRVGLTEREARESGLDIATYSMPMQWVGRAQEMDETRGLMKVVVDTTDECILGCAILGVEGGELMSLLQMAMMGGVTATRLRDAVFAHPTLAESLNNLFAR